MYGPYSAKNDKIELTAFLEDIQTSMCDIMVFYISAVLSFLAERPNKDWVVLRGNEGDSIEIDGGRHSHGSDDDRIEVTGSRHPCDCDEILTGQKLWWTELL
jgi:hypothetical protein